jgi:uncharacterized protein (DUF433 family)
VDRTTWIDRIVLNAEIMRGKPVVRGTRIPVETVLRHLADGLDVEEVLTAFPRLSREDVRACVQYAHDLVAGEMLFPRVETGPIPDA